MGDVRKLIHGDGLVAALGFLVAGAYLLGLFGNLHWIFDLFSHFRMQYLVVLTIVVCFFGIRKRYIHLIVYACFLIIVGGTVLPLYMGKPKATSSNSTRIMLVNVLTHNDKKELLRKEIENTDPQIVVLEELDSTWLHFLSWMNSAYSHTVLETREDNFGIGLWSKSPLRNASIENVGPANVPSIFATVTIDSQEVQLIATHPVPPAGKTGTLWRNEQLEDLASKINRVTPTILIGDLNTSCWGSSFKRLLKETGLKNSSKGFGFQATWPAGKPILFTAIDHMLHSQEIVVVDRTIGSDVGSDHLPLIIDFVLEK